MRKRHGKFSLVEVVVLLFLVGIVVTLLSPIRNLWRPTTPVAQPTFNTHFFNGAVEIVDWDFEKNDQGDGGQLHVKMRSYPPSTWSLAYKEEWILQKARSVAALQIAGFKKEFPGAQVERISWNTKGPEETADPDDVHTTVVGLYNVTIVPVEVTPVREGVLRVAVRDDYGVLSDMNDETGAWSGAAPFFARMIAREMGYKEVEFVRTTTVENIYGVVRPGEADLAIGMLSITESRKRDFDFSKPYLSTGLVVAALNSEPYEALSQGRADIGDYHVAVSSHTTAEDYAKKRFGDDFANVSTYGTSRNAYNAFNNAIEHSSTSVIIVDEAIAATWPNALIVDLPEGRILQKEEYGVVVQKGNQELIDGVNATIDNAQITEMYHSFLGRQ